MIENNDRSFLNALQVISIEASKKSEMEMKEIFSILAEKGYAALLVILSLPFCLPVQIPGFSTPFGIALGLLGLRIGLGKQPWWPEFILTRKLSSETVHNITEKTISAVKKMQKVTHPRLYFFTKNPICHRLNGLLVFILAILLALPLPIPLTNLLAALPIFFIGIGILEDDGLFIILGYIFSLICFAFFFSLYFFSAYLIKTGMEMWFA